MVVGKESPSPGPGPDPEPGMVGFSVVGDIDEEGEPSGVEKKEKNREEKK